MKNKSITENVILYTCSLLKSVNEMQVLSFLHKVNLSGFI